MIQKTYYYQTDSTEPFHNLALERHFLETVPQNSCLLYLWQNQNTVVIGKNQNCWKECKLAELAEAGGTMVRRLSGGGAVYHDLGNLNFTFLVSREDYDVNRQLQVILEALRALGIHAEQTGRNDITADGRKFSGNAFYESGGRCYHHGTLMVQVDRALLGKYLQVSASKLAAKGVASVQSRVVNLTELKPELTIQMLSQALIDAMETVYGVAAQPYPQATIDQDLVAQYAQEFASEDWRFGQKLPFTWEMEHRFPWGNVHLQCSNNYGRIEQAVMYSDAMDAVFIEKMANALQGCSFGSAQMIARLMELEDRQERNDFCQYLQSLSI